MCVLCHPTDLSIKLLSVRLILIYFFFNDICGMKWVFAKDVSIGLQFARSDMVTARSEAKRVVQTQNGKTGM